MDANIGLNEVLVAEASGGYVVRIGNHKLPGVFDSEESATVAAGISEDRLVLLWSKAIDENRLLGTADLA